MDCDVAGVKSCPGRRREDFFLGEAQWPCIDLTPILVGVALLIFVAARCQFCVRIRREKATESAVIFGLRLIFSEQFVCESRGIRL